MSAGYSVTAIVRSEKSLEGVTHPSLSVGLGDVCEINFLRRVFPGHNVVISALGPRRPAKKKDCEIYSTSSRVIVEAMSHGGVERLLVVFTALLYPAATLLDQLIRVIAKQNALHADQMEKTVSSSNLAWTIARVGFPNNKKNW